MHHKEFLKLVDEAQVVAAIGKAEANTSGEIRVYVSHKERHNAMEAAKVRFVELGMSKTRHRNGVLIYIVPRTRQFAVLGDQGVHEKCGDAFWKQVATGMSARMKEGRFTEAIVQAISEIGAVLAQHFPPDGENPNELSNEVARD